MNRSLVAHGLAFSRAGVTRGLPAARSPNSRIIGCFRQVHGNKPAVVVLPDSAPVAISTIPSTAAADRAKYCPWIAPSLLRQD
jgi:hypothetical protein